MQTNFELVECKKESVESKKNDVANTPQSNKVTRLQKLCEGVSREEKKIFSIIIATKNHVASYKDMKDVLIHLRKFKPNEFTGLTFSNELNAFTAMTNSPAMGRYIKNLPALNSVNIYMMREENLKAGISSANLLCSKIVLNSKDKVFKRTASTLQQALITHNWSEYMKFLKEDEGHDSLNSQ